MITSRRAYLGQLLLVLLMMPMAYFTPPAHGRMLLVPLTATAHSALFRVSVDGGARLIGRGPITGSFVVWGDRERLFGTLARHGIIALAGRGAGCETVGRNSDDASA